MWSRFIPPSVLLVINPEVSSRGTLNTGLCLLTPARAAGETNVYYDTT